MVRLLEKENVRTVGSLIGKGKHGGVTRRTKSVVSAEFPTVSITVSITR